MKSSTPKKFQFDFNGVTFTLPGKYYRTTDYYGKPIKPHIHVDQVAAAKLIKQYVKTKYPNVVCTALSDSYSGGCSTRVALSDKYGFPVDEKIHDDVSDFGKKFQYGRFNGMEDIYEYNGNTHNTEKGMAIDPSVKYVFVKNHPDFDSIPDICKSIMETMKGGKYQKQENRPHTMEEAVEILRDFHKNERRIQKAIELVKEYNS